MATWILLMSSPRHVRDLGRQPRALARVDLEPPAQGLDPLAHPAKPVALLLYRATPVVVHRQTRPAAVSRQLQPAARRACVAQDVGDRLALESVLSLVLREAVTNILRHAGATSCRLELAADSGGTRLSVHDNGRGAIEK